MPCDVFDAIATATESLPRSIYARLQPKSLWMNLTPREAFKRNTGLEQTTYVMGNVEPDDNPVWQAESLVTEENVEGACAIPDTDLQWGFDQRVYSPEKLRLRGPVLCKDEFTYNYMPDKFMGGYIDRIAKASDRTMSFRLQEHYLSLSNKYVAGDNTIIAGSTLAPGTQYASLPAIEPTSELTQDMLDEIAVNLNDLGAADQTDPTQWGFYDWGQNGPLYTLYIGQQMSNKILKNDPTRVTVLNYSDMGKGEDALLRKRIAASVQFYNFRHVINPIPPRYVWDGDSLVRIPVFISIAASGKGFKSVINPAWQAAPIEAAFVLHPLVMTDHLVEPEVNPAGLPFDPTNYYGEWSFIKGAYRLGLDCEDPEDKFGRHYATYRHAVEAVQPDYGYSILFRRCIGSPYEVSCSY